MEENNIEKIEKFSGRKKTTLIVMAIIVAVIYLVFTVVIGADWLRLSSMADSNEKQLSIGLFLTFVVIIIGVCAYAAASVISLIGWIMSSAWHKKTGNLKGWKIYFAVMTFLPIITEIVAILLAKTL